MIRQAKVAFTSANPFTYADDNVFGYMRAQREQDGGTVTRISPLRCSPLVPVTSQSPVDDFGVIARQRDGDPVPFEHQFYAVTLKGIFSLDLSGVGTFGELPKTGYKNLDARYIARPEMQQAIQAVGAVRNGNDSWEAPRALRLWRVRDTLAVLPYVGGGAKLTLHLTDVTPKMIILTIIQGGNQLFMNITREDDQRSINSAALRQVLTDYQDIILSDVFIGRQEGFQDALAPDLSRLTEELHPLKVDLETIYELESTPLRAKSNVVKREILVEPQLFLYLTDLNLAESFTHPRYPLLLGRSTELAMVSNRPQIVELEERHGLRVGGSLFPFPMEGIYGPIQSAPTGSGKPRRDCCGLAPTRMAAGGFFISSRIPLALTR